jgi:hypothetical protein
MKFYSGFSLKNEEYLFKEYINESLYSVCGFSYGAIKALHYVENELKNSQRVDRLQLFSPAFFQTKDEKFQRLQLMSYRKNRAKYMKQFLASCFAPYEEKIVEQGETNEDELKELLTFEWFASSLENLSKKGVKIEVYLGSEDKIIDVESARAFFLQQSTVTYIKNANHFLQIN